MPLQPSQMSVRELLEVVCQRWWYFLACTLLGLALSILALYKMDKIYQSRSTILVEDRQASDPMIKGLGVSTSVNQRFNTVQAKIMSIARLTKMAVALNIAPPGLADAQLRGVIKDLQRSASMRLYGGIISIRAERKDDPFEARDIVGYLVNAVIDENLKIREDQIQDAMTLLDGLLLGYKDDLDQAEMVLRDFQEIHQLELSSQQTPAEALSNVTVLSQIGSGPNSKITRLLDVTVRLADNDIRLKSLEAKLARLEERLEEEPSFTVSEVTSTPSELTRQLQQLHGRAGARLAEMRSAGMTDEHPMVADKLSEIARLEKQVAGTIGPVTIEEKKSVNQIATQLKMEVHELESEIVALETEQEHLGKRAAVLTEEIKAIPAKELKKSHLQREKSIQASTYRSIRLRYENALLTHKIESADRDTRFTVLDPPTLEEHPIRPKKEFVLAMGMFLGMIVGVAMSFAKEFTDTSFRNLDDASRYLDLPVLGVIPAVEKSWWRRWTA